MPDTHKKADSGACDGNDEKYENHRITGHKGQVACHGGNHPGNKLSSSREDSR